MTIFRKIINNHISTLRIIKKIQVKNPPNGGDNLQSEVR